MTYISSSDAVASNKPYISMPTNSPIAIASGVVQHPLLSPSDQIMILSVINETGSSSVGDVMAALELHIDAAGAVQALITTGVIASDIRNGVLDQHFQLTRILPADPDGGGAGPSAPGGASPASARPSADLVSISLSQLHPNIVVAPGTTRRTLGRFAALQRPAFMFCFRAAIAMSA